MSTFNDLFYLWIPKCFRLFNTSTTSSPVQLLHLAHVPPSYVPRNTSHMCNPVMGGQAPRTSKHLAHVPPSCARPHSSHMCNPAMHGETPRTCATQLCTAERLAHVSPSYAPQNTSHMCSPVRDAILIQTWDHDLELPRENTPYETWDIDARGKIPPPLWDLRYHGTFLFHIILLLFPNTPKIKTRMESTPRAKV